MEQDLVQYARAGWCFLGFTVVDLASIVCLRYLLKRNEMLKNRGPFQKRRLSMLTGKTKDR